MNEVKSFGFSAFIPVALVFGLSLAIPGARAETGGQTAAKAPDAESAEPAVPLLEPDLGNLWDGSWRRDWARGAAAQAGGTAAKFALREALRAHRAAFSELPPGRRETRMIELRNALPDEVSGGTGDESWNRILERLATRIPSLYRGFHESLLDERFATGRSLDDLRFGAYGQAALDGTLLVETIAYVTEVERRRGEAVRPRVEALLKDRADRFAGWVRQLRRPEQAVCAMVWEDWAATGGLGYAPPAVEDAARAARQKAMTPWYEKEFLPEVAQRIGAAVREESPFDTDGLAPEIEEILALMPDRDRYEAAVRKWAEANAETLNDLGLEPDPERAVAALLRVDAESGAPASSDIEESEAFLRTALYRRFQRGLRQEAASRNERIRALVRELSHEQRKELSAAARIFREP